MTRNANRSPTVGDTGGEGADVASLVTAGEAKIVVISVDCDVLRVPEAEFLDGGLDSLHTTGLAHFFGTEISVAASTVPVAFKGLGMEGDLDAPLFRNANKKIAGHPKVITHGNTLAGTDLEFPLRRHDLSIDAADVDACIETGTVVSLN